MAYSRRTLQCPKCEHPLSKVTAGNDVVYFDDLPGYKRYRKCSKCKGNFTSWEYISEEDIKEVLNRGENHEMSKVRS